MQPVLALLLCCFPVAACKSGDRSDDAGVVVRDSAGVRIVENPGELWAGPEHWTLSAQPLLSIGVADGEEPYLLDGVRGILPLEDGRVVVANGGDHTLRWYDASGTFLFQRGGEGGGPGEFSRLGGVALGLADTILAMDWSARRLTMFTADGELAGTRPVDGLTGPPGRVYRLTDGSLVTGTSGFSSAELGGNLEPRRVRLPSPLLHLSPDGARVDTIGMFPGEDIQVMSMGGGLAFGGAALGRRTSYAVARDAIHVGTQDAFVIDVFSPDGRLVRSIRAPGTPLLAGSELTAAWAAFIQERMADVPPDERAEAERANAQMELPESAPAYSEFVVDDEDNLWVAEYRFDLKAPRRWIVFDADGRFVTTVAVPDEFRVLAVRDDRVLGRATDQLGVQQVVVYGLERHDVD